jgi:hypothetical protein
VSFAWQRDGLNQVAGRHPEGVAFLCVIGPMVAPPTEELRRASTRMLDEHADRLKCVAVVIESVGFRGAVTRGVLSGMALLRPRSHPASAFASVPEALAWIDEHVPIESMTAALEKIEQERRILTRSTF